MIPNFNNNGPCYELLSSATDIIKYWKQKGKITREFESHTKSYIYSLSFGGVSMLSIPINEKHSLQINNSCLLFQFILFNTKSFSIEIVIRDKNDTKRRFNLTTSVKEIDSKSLYIKIPLIDYPLNIWTNLIIDLEALTQHHFKTQAFKSIDNIHISGCLKIRKIFSLRTKDEPVLRSVDMGKSIPIANLFLLESGNTIKNDLKIIGANNLYINNVNINSNNFQSPLAIRKGTNSPPSHNMSKVSNTSDINLNKHRNYYRKNNENNSNILNENNSNNNLSEGLNITPLSNINRVQMENLSKKAKDNVLNAKKFVRGLPNLSNVKNDIKYAAFRNMKNNNIGNLGNIGNTSNYEENENSSGSNKLLNTNLKEKNKSLGKYVKHQQNKKRNKSNNPYINHKNKKSNENIDFLSNMDNKFTSNKNIIREENNILNNNNSNKINKKENTNINKEKKVNKNNVTPIKSRDKEKENKELPNNNNIYYNKKEQEISMEEYHANKNKIQNKNQKNEEKNINDKFKFNNISLPNSIKENKENNNKDNDNKQNKYSNYNNMLLDSGFDIKNIPIYDSIEEIAEWPADLNANANNANLDNVEKMGDKLILLDSGNNQKSNENNENDNIEGDDFLEISSLFKKKDTLRPYTPPIEELVPVNPKKMKGDSNMKVSIDKKNSLMSTNRILKNYENLIYNPDKGLFYDPKTNIYYDIKAK